MAKPTLNKLKLTPKESVKTLVWNEQEIEIKPYLSIQTKLEMISEILNLAADDNRFYNPGKVDMFFALKVIEYYTNLSITEKQKENPIKLYDEFMASGFYNAVFNSIPEGDVGYVYTIMKETIDQIYKYQNSAYGIMDAMSTDYNNLNFDIQKLTEQIGNKENAQFLDQVISKLG